MKAPDNHSHVVRPDNMEWQKTRFEGCEVKILMFDKKSGMATALMRLAPEMARHVSLGGSLILSGILERQRDAVIAAYVGQKFRHVRTLEREGWVTLHLKR